MIDLRDFTFTIPIKYDTDDRIENAKFVIEYIRKHMKTNIIVCEEDSDKKFDWVDAEYIFIESNDPLFHRTKILNMMAKKAKTKYIVNYDIDVILPVDSYKKAADMIRSGRDMIYPFTVFRTMGRRHLEVLRKNYLIDDISKDEVVKFGKHDTSVGGVVFWNKEKFVSIGMENEHFVSWGWEDLERFERAKKLDTKIDRVKGDVYHIEHQRKTNSSTSNPMQLKNYNEYIKVKDMPKEKLIDYIKTWEWARY